MIAGAAGLTTTRCVGCRRVWLCAVLRRDALDGGGSGLVRVAALGRRLRLGPRVGERRVSLDQVDQRHATP